MTDNLALWAAVERTDPEQTKPITGKPYKGTSPKPYHLVHKATEIFGPCGIGWGFEIVRERVEDGAPGDKVHIAHVRVWYKWNGERGVVEHVGQTMFSGKNKNGPFTDEDAPKKSVTDAIVKALSLIGFAGDIFMGRYDDSKYVNEIRAEIAEEHRTDQKPNESMSAYLKIAHDHIKTIDTAASLRSWWEGQKDMRVKIGVVKGTREYESLFGAFADRGRALSTTSKVEAA
jgi:hypothetical protein